MGKNMEKADRYQVIVIGLDGATFDLIKPWIEKGDLPRLRDLMRKGVWGELKSTIPPITAPAFASFMTGKNLGKHGIFGFTQTDWVNHLGWTLPIHSGRLVSSLSIKDKIFWEILSDEGKKIGIINIPLTYPPKKVNGVLISGFMTPPGSNNFTYPEELREEIKGYKIDVESLANWLFTDKGITEKIKKEELLQDQYDVTKRRASIIIKLLNNEHFDFFLCFFKGTDNLMHYFWNDKKTLLSYYKLLDEIISDIIESCNKNRDLIIFSDHGFGPEAKKIFFVNTWLRKNGYLISKRGIRGNLSTEIFKVTVKILRHLKLIRYMPKSIKNKGVKSKYSIINFDKTVAICEIIGSVSGIRINPKKKDKITEIKKQLHNLKDPDNGKNIFASIYAKEEIYSGKFLDCLPELIIIPNHDYLISADLFEKKITKYHVSIREGNHINGYLEGILIVEGKNIKKGGKMKGAKLIDLAPTILHLMGKQVPIDMEGNVLFDIFKEESDPARRSIKYSDNEKERIREKVRKIRRL